MSVIVVLSQTLPAPFLQALGQLGELRVRGQYQGELFEQARVVVATVADAVDQSLVDALPDSVGLIANIGVGTDNIDLAAASARGILVSNTPVVTEDTADLAFALILAASRRLPAAERLLRTEQWGLAQTRLSSRVHGKTLGIVGFGEIGQAVARRASGFSMKVQYWGPRRKQQAERDCGASWCESLESLLQGSDIVSLHCPLGPQTHHLLGAAELALCKPGAVLVNTGRGPLIDEQALVQALQQGPLGAAGLDVFEYEPAVNTGLLALDNVVLTPHVGSATAECRADMARCVMANIQQYLASASVLNPVG